MGALIKRPQTSHEVHCQLNCRFAPGDALQEMVSNHLRFNIFSPSNSLDHIYPLLGIGPVDLGERAEFYSFLNYLKTIDSDVAGESGHDRIVRARRENLEDKAPLPMYTTSHRWADNRTVTVTKGHPLPHDHLEYIIISVPMRPGPYSAASAA